MLMGSIVLGMTSSVWLPMLFGKAYESSIHLLNWLLLAGLGMTFSTLMAPQWIGQGLFLPASMLTIASGVINVALNYFLIPAYGALGAIYSVLITYALAVIVHVVMFVHCDKTAQIQVNL